MNIAECQAIADLLASAAGVRRVIVKEIRGDGAYYYSGRNRIGIGKHCTGRGRETTVLHEFAHHLEWCRYNGRAEKGVSHGPAFVRALVDTATAWYGDPGKYDWGSEYSKVQRIYKQRHNSEYLTPREKRQKECEARNGVFAIEEALRFG